MPETAGDSFKITDLGTPSKCQKSQRAILPRKILILALHTSPAYSETATFGDSQQVLQKSENAIFLEEVLILALPRSPANA